MVAKCIERFIKVWCASPSRIDYPADMIRGREVHSSEHLDRESSSDWRVGPGFIEVDRLVLFSLDRVSRMSWQPRIGVLPG